MSKRTILTGAELRRIIEAVIRENSGIALPDMSAKAGELLDILGKINKALAADGVRIGISSETSSEQRVVSFSLEFGNERYKVDTAEALHYWLGEAADTLNLTKDWIHDWAGSLPWGTVAAWYLKNCQSKKKKGVWEVQRAEARRGWGILLYEVSLELASLSGGALVSDRSSVSDNALGVWSKYDLNRHDVKKLQLDVDKHTAKHYELEQLTHRTWDDCYQGSAYNHKGKEWHESPLSKAYRKAVPTIVPALKGAGLFWEV